MAEHWAHIPERKGILGLRFLFWCYRYFGYRLISWLLRPVALIFYLSSRSHRRASQQYLAQVSSTALVQSVELARLSGYAHFLRFAHAILDKLASWSGDWRFGEQVVYAADTPCRLQPSGKRGCVILASHLGDIEVCRALTSDVGLTVHALVFNRHARGFNQLLMEVNPQVEVNLIQVDQLGPDTAILLKEKIDQGDWVAIVGDRIPLQVNQVSRADRVVWSEFLGKSAPFPQGPFILAALLKCPVYLMFALKKCQQIEIYCELFADPLSLPRSDRVAGLQKAVDQYAQRLSHYCLKSPYDWFNFYDFWSLPKQGKT